MRIMKYFLPALLLAALLSPQAAKADSNRLTFVVSGVVVKILVKAGDKVNAGAVLAKLDPVPFQARLSSAQASLKSATVANQQAQANLKRVQQMFDDLAASGENLEKAQLQAAKAAADQARSEARVKMGSWRLSKATLTAPQNGQITSVTGYLGQVISRHGEHPTVVFLEPH